jgi:hypothetical protein
MALTPTIAEIGKTTRAILELPEEPSGVGRGALLRLRRACSALHAH